MPIVVPSSRRSATLQKSEASCCRTGDGDLGSPEERWIAASGHMKNTIIKEILGSRVARTDIDIVLTSSMWLSLASRSLTSSTWYESSQLLNFLAKLVVFRYRKSSGDDDESKHYRHRDRLTEE